MDILRIAGLALLGSFTAMLLKGSKGEFSMLVGLAMALLVCGYVVVNLLEVVTSIEGLWNRVAGDTEFLHILLRIVGITYISDLTSGICKECGYGVLAGQVAVAGKMGVLLAGFPIFMNLLEFVMELGA
jgi:stage III sporulation protein AD